MMMMMGTAEEGMSGPEDVRLEIVLPPRLLIIFRLIFFYTVSHL